MSVFGNKATDYVTRTEAEGALSAYVTKEEVQAARDVLASVEARVTALETLAAEVRAGAVTLNNAVTSPLAAGGRSVHLGSTQAETNPTDATGVDYAAVAFGLSEIKRKVAPLISRGDYTSEVTREYRGAVQYFADVFAKSDPAFDADQFKADAGL